MRPSARQRPGFVLIVALIICFAIASLVITLGRLARTEAMASANQLATYEAASVEKGAEQYVRAIASDLTQLDTLDETDFEAQPVGTGYFWIVRPDYLDEDLPKFGLVDEAAKIALTSGVAKIGDMSGMSPEIATAIEEWRGSVPDSGRYGTSGYAAKGAKFETPEELMLVQGITREMYYGDAAMALMGAPASTALVGNDAVRAAGLQNFFTPFETLVDPMPQGQTGLTQINVNQAPRDVLVCMFGNTIPESAVDTALAQRAAAVNSNPSDASWALTAFEGLNALQRQRIVGRGKKFSADIVAVAGNGRAFKRVRIVIDTTATPPRIVYRRDITDQGFPLDASILTSMRAGQSPSASSSSRMGSSAR